MSLFSYMNVGTSQTSNNFSSSSVYNTALEQLISAKNGLTGNTTASGNASSGVTISVAASIASAAKDDAKKDAATLAKDIRKTLDTQYGKDNTGKADFTEMSPRALSTIMLNESGSFSKAEMIAAKQEMRSRDRDAFLTATANDLSVDTLKTYQTALMTGRSTMSIEERTVRDARYW